MNDLIHHALLEEWLDAPIASSLLIAGPAGIGKSAFAEALARRLTGAEENATIHQDIVTVRPNEELKTRPIDVAAIRAMTKGLSLTAAGASRVALVLEADRMTEGAANALLKTLEEPPAGTFIILTAAEPWRLPATIRSRLALRRLPVPTEDEALAFLNDRLPDLKDSDARTLLRLAGGAPLLAVELLQGGVAAAESIVKLAEAAARGQFDRKAASELANKAGDAGWRLFSRLVLRFLHLAGVAAGGAQPVPATAAEGTALKAFAAKAGTVKCAEAWRIAAELQRATEDQALAKSWQLYRMMLSFEWACR